MTRFGLGNCSIPLKATPSPLAFGAAVGAGSSQGRQVALLLARWDHWALLGSSPLGLGSRVSAKDRGQRLTSLETRRPGQPLTWPVDSVCLPHLSPGQQQLRKSPADSSQWEKTQKGLDQTPASVLLHPPSRTPQRGFKGISASSKFLGMWLFLP